MTQIFKLLSDESRLRIAYLLSKEDLCVCELVGITGLPQPKISKILSKFRDLGLVTDERKDKFIFYRLNQESHMLIEILSYMESHLSAYPLLEEDRDRLLHKEDHIDKCTLKSLRQAN